MADKPPGKRNPLAELTSPECEYFRKMCNFTPEELEVFDLRAKDKSVVYISMQLCMSESTVKRINKRIKLKMYKVL